METVTSGSILVDGQDITQKKVDLNKVRQKVGMVFQHFNLFEHLTVMENMTLAPVDLKKENQPDAEDTALRLLKRVGLADKTNCYPRQLSGGQKQRVAIARALAMKPGDLAF